MRLCIALWLIFAGIVCSAEPVDALAELDADRAKRGLYPYQYDAELTKAAATLATYRAEHRITGHVGGQMGDFAFMPSGLAECTGCAAWKDGFGACQMHGTTYRTAGAAKVRGADGLFYCHLVLRKGPPTSTVSFTPPLGAAPVTPKEYPIMGGFNEGKPANYKKSPDLPRIYSSAKTVHCIVYTDMTKTKILREHDEPAPAWMSNPSCTGCVDCACPTGDCVNGKCPAVRK